MKTITIIISILMTFTIVNAQQLIQTVVSTTGNTSQQGNVQISYTVGETVIHTLSTSNNTLTQGFQQPHYNITFIPQQSNENNINIFPNPASDELFLQSPFEQETNWEISLFDMSGKCLLLQKHNLASKSTITIPMQQIATGKYILTIFVKEYSTTTKYEIIKTK